MPKLTNSAEQPIRCGTFGEKAVRPQKVQFEQAERYRDIANRLMEHYVGLFPDCAWVDEESAIARMALDITRLRRREIRHLQAILRMHEALKAVVGMRKPHPKVRDAHAMANLADQALDTELHMGDAGYFRESGPASMNGVLASVKECRALQDEQWGGPEHDDTHAAHEWLGFIQKQLDEADVALDPPPGGSNLDIYESRLIDVAALAVAAIQSNRRKRNA